MKQERSPRCLEYGDGRRYSQAGGIYGVYGQFQDKKEVVQDKISGKASARKLGDL